MTYCVPKQQSHNVNEMQAENLIVRDEHRLRDAGNPRTDTGEGVRNWQDT